MSVTLRDIAGTLKVSPNTVSRALRSKSDISAEMTERVQTVARAMGYRPNVASRALKYDKFHNIGMLMGGADEFYLPQQTLGAFSKALSEKGYSCSLVCSTSVDPAHLYLSPLLKARLVDSVVIGYIQELPKQVVDDISAMDVPVVWLNRWLEHDSVVVGEADSVWQLVAHLVDCKYQRLMYIDYTGGGEGWVVQRHLQAFDAAAEKFGVQPLRMTHRRVAREERFAATRDWLSKPDRPRAVIVSSFTAAQAILETALCLGLRVPQDIAICSFDDGRRYTSSVPSMTCAIRPEAEFGSAAAEMALAKALNRDEPVLRREVNCTLAIGGTTVPDKSCIYLADHRKYEN